MSGCAEPQACPRLCYSHATKSGFLASWPVLSRETNFLCAHACTSLYANKENISEAGLHE